MYSTVLKNIVPLELIETYRACRLCFDDRLNVARFVWLAKLLAFVAPWAQLKLEPRIGNTRHTVVRRLEFPFAAIAYLQRQRTRSTYVSTAAVTIV